MKLIHYPTIPSQFTIHNFPDITSAMSSGEITLSSKNKRQLNKLKKLLDGYVNDHDKDMGILFVSKEVTDTDNFALEF